jgi:ABC-2 type transport system permease protein
VLTLAATAVASAATGLKLDGGNLAAATLSIIPLGLLMAAIGYLLSGWLRTALDTGLLSFLLVIWFFISFVGPGLNWSDTTLRLSAIYYYGTPLLHGLPLLDTLGVLAVGIVALALASVRFVRKDIGLLSAVSAFEELHQHGDEDFVGWAVVLTWKAVVLRIQVSPSRSS